MLERENAKQGGGVYFNIEWGCGGLTKMHRGLLSACFSILEHRSERMGKIPPRSFASEACGNGKFSDAGADLWALWLSPGRRNHAAWVISSGAEEITEITQNRIKIIHTLFFYSFLGDFCDFFGPGRNHVTRLISVPPGPVC